MKRSRTAGSKFGKAKRSKKNDGRDSSSEPCMLTEEGIDDILERVATGQTELSSQNETIYKLKKQVDDLQSTVAELKSQVSYLRSALDWTLQRSAVPAKYGTASTTSITTAGQTGATTSGPSAGSSSGVEPSTEPPSTADDPFTEVIGHRHAKMQRTARDAVVAAVYVDQQRRNDRVANLVVSGVQPMSQVADNIIIANIIRSEIGVEPDIVHCRRLGKITAGKVQPLLVVLRSASHADEILACAKNLRKSIHSVVKDHVFINRHLTDAQARAAYEMRCQRREAAKHHTRHGAGDRASGGLPVNSTVPAASSSSSSSAAPTAAVDAAAVSAIATAVAAASGTVSSAGLNATAAVFAPTESK